jgi:hypothetical protein
MVAALPALAPGYNEDWSGFFTDPGALLVFNLGEFRRGRVDATLPNWSQSNQHATTAVCENFVLPFPGLVIFTVLSDEIGFNGHMRFDLLSIPFFVVSVAQTAHSPHLHRTAPRIR